MISKKAYEITQPWLDFASDLRQLRDIARAFNELVQDLEKNGHVALTTRRIGWINEAILRDPEIEAYSHPGQARISNVVVGLYRCRDRRDVRYLLEHFCDVFNDDELPEDNRISFAILKAILAHLYFVWIHPFGDGNGHTAQLIELAILLKADLPQPACHLLRNHYDQT